MRLRFGIIKESYFSSLSPSDHRVKGFFLSSRLSFSSAGLVLIGLCFLSAAFEISR